MFFCQLSFNVLLFSFAKSSSTSLYGLTPMKNSFSRWFFLGSLILIAPIFSGCSSSTSTSRGKISGQVLLDGKPLPLGQIEFTNEKGLKGRGMVIEGKYSANVPDGDLKVVVKTSYINQEYFNTLKQEISGQMALASAEAEGAQSEEGKAMAKKILAIIPKAKRVPKKYENYSSSGLTVTVSSEETKKDFELSSK